ACVWHAPTGAPLGPRWRAGHYVFHLDFSPDGSRLLACGEDRIVRTYDANTGKRLLELPHQGPEYWAHFSPEGRMSVTRPMYANPMLWNAQTGALIHELKEPTPQQATTGFVTRGDFSRDGSWLPLRSGKRYAPLPQLPRGKLASRPHHD